MYFTCIFKSLLLIIAIPIIYYILIAIFNSFNAYSRSMHRVLINVKLCSETSIYINLMLNNAVYT